MGTVRNRRLPPKLWKKGVRTMPQSPKQEKARKPNPPRTAPKDKPPRDTRENPAPNPDGPSELPDTNTREEVEAIRPNLKR